MYNLHQRDATTVYKKQCLTRETSKGKINSYATIISQGKLNPHTCFDVPTFCTTSDRNTYHTIAREK